MKKTYAFSEIKDKLLFDGRVLMREDGAILGWEGSGFEFRGEFEGEISIGAECSSPFYYDKTYWLGLYYVVDGEPHKTGRIFNETQSLTVANVEKGFHTIKVIKSSQSIFNSIKIKSITFDGKIGEKPEEKKLAVEFIGDSITAGSVVMSYESDPPDLEIDTSSDSYWFYPGVACRLLDAKMYDVSTGGVGLVNREGGFGTNADSYYEFTDYYHDREEKWDFEKNRSDVVVIALGTNDGAYHEKQDEYIEIARKFLRKVRKNNPGAYIFWIYGMMFRNFEGLFKRLIDEENDGRMKYIPMPTDNRGGYDHPGKAAHIEYGRIIAEEIKKIL